MTKHDRPPAFLLYVDDFVSDGIVEAMTTEEVGAYFLLLCKAWREEPAGTIPNNDRVLARWTRLTPDQWAECKPGVLAAFKLGTDGRYHQSRMRHEFQKLARVAKQRSQSAKTASEARWGRRRETPENGEDLCASDASRIADGMPENAIQRQRQRQRQVNERSFSASTSSLTSRSSTDKNGRSDVDAHRFELSEEQIGQAVIRFERAKRIAKPATKDPQRAADLDLLAKAAILSVTTFSEDWLVDSCEATRLNKKDGPACRYLHGVLKEKAKLNGFDLNRCLAKTLVPTTFFDEVIESGDE